MKITIEKQNDVAILKVSGNLDADSVAQFKKTANQLVEEGQTRLVMDCQTLHFIDSMGLGAMISLLRKVRIHQGDLKVSNVNPEVRSVFEITRLHRLFDILPDWQSACEKF